MSDTLWQKLTTLCSASPDSIYKADWDRFYLDTGGYTINSLVQWYREGKIALTLQHDMGTYHISIVQEQAHE